jgi:hypothetical protein
MNEATLLDLNQDDLSFHLTDNANKLAHDRMWESPFMKPPWRTIRKRRAGGTVDDFTVMAFYVHEPVDISRK